MEGNQNKKLIMTSREEEVAILLCQGMTAKESSTLLNVKQKTIEKHIENIKRKVGFHTKFKLIKALEKYFC